MRVRTHARKTNVSANKRYTANEDQEECSNKKVLKQRDVELEAFREIEEDVLVAKQALLEHPMFAMVRTRNHLRTFMEVHVFAVWDFMSLVKRLQSEFAGTSLPWIPPVDSHMGRFVNEVVLTKESDRDWEGGTRSHLEMYLAAMNELGASTTEFLHFLEDVEERSVEYALRRLEPTVRWFVGETLACAIHARPVEVLATFLYGREDVIPHMFHKVLDTWSVTREETPGLHYYLQRHIELDGDEHGPLAEQALRRLAGDDSRKWSLAKHRATRAIRARMALWDAVCDRLTA